MFSLIYPPTQPHRRPQLLASSGTPSARRHLFVLAAAPPTDTVELAPELRLPKYARERRAMEDLAALAPPARWLRVREALSMVRTGIGPDDRLAHVRFGGGRRTCACT
jgi:hypothetical protein